MYFADRYFASFHYTARASFPIFSRHQTSKQRLGTSLTFVRFLLVGFFCSRDKRLNYITNERFTLIEKDQGNNEILINERFVSKETVLPRRWGSKTFYDLYNFELYN